MALDRSNSVLNSCGASNAQAGRKPAIQENGKYARLSSRSSERGSRESNPACELDACLRDKVKLQRAYGECLGSQRR